MDFKTRFINYCKAFNRRRKRWIALFVVVAHLAGALTSVQAVMEVRTSQGAIAWAVSLNTFPYLAVPAYWVFGRSEFKGYVPLLRADQEGVRTRTTTFLELLKDQNLLGGQPVSFSPSPVEKLAGFPMTVGNEVELLIDGKATFASIFSGIERAQEYVLVQFYIIRDDTLGRQLRDHLLAKAKSGVPCYLLYDEIGSAGLPKRYLQELWDGGVFAAPFNSTKGVANRFQLNFRNHRKIVVVDGKEAWTGGLNVGDEYVGIHKKLGAFRDTHLRVAGPAVLGAQLAFVQDWHWARGETPALNWKPQAAPEQSHAVLPVASGPADAMETCTLFFLDLINRSKKRLWIASPYFVPDEQFITALKLAALRGVDVKILIPDKNDSQLVELTAWSYVAELEQAGIGMWRHLPGFMHQKVVLMDDSCTIGTANFDNRSFRLNFEFTMLIESPEFSRQVEAMLRADFANARLSKAAELEAKGFLFRLGTRVSRLMSPIQ